MRRRATSLCAAGALIAAAAAAQTIIIDNVDPGFTPLSGTWLTGSSATNKYGADYRFADGVDLPNPPTAVCEWRPTISTAGNYQVSVWYNHAASAPNNRATNAPYRVIHSGGSQTFRINQETGGGAWVPLGTFPFAAGTGGRVELSNDSESGNVVIADAVQFVYTGALPSDEMRAMWISRFEWPSTSETTTKNNLDSFMQDLADHNFNAAFVQVRGQCDTLYPSPYEPWSPIISPTGTDPGWSVDPLQYAINAAHSRGLQFHAYFNTHTVWQSGTSSPPSGAGYANHIYYQHANAADPAHRDWLIHDSLGNPVQWEESNYVWLAPGVPAMQAYVRQQIMHLVNTYDIDGLHWDRIRTPGPEYSHDPISLARWDNPSTPTPNDGTGNPHNLDFDAWTTDQITRFTIDAYAEILRADPTIAVSSAPLGLHTQSDYSGYPSSFQYGVEKTHQDAAAWLAMGSQDFICPQIYWADGGADPDFSEVWPPWLNYANTAGRWVVAGSTNGNGQTEVENHALIARSTGGFGHITFSITSTSAAEFDSWLANVYTTPAPVPTPSGFPWRATEGIICGRVYEVNGTTPVTDAWITRTGSSWTAVSSGDGFYAFLRVPPGTYTLNAEHPTLGTRQVTGVVVSAGAVTTVDITMPLPVTLSTFGQD